MFNGWDYTELSEEWKLYFPDSFTPEFEKLLKGDETPFKYDQDYYLKIFIENFLLYRIMGKSTDQYSKFQKKAISDIRKYLQELSRCPVSYFQQLWKTISEIEDDFSMLQIIVCVIGHAWC